MPPAYRQTDRHTDTQTHTQTDRQTDTQTQTQRHRDIDTQTHRHTDTHTITQSHTNTQKHSRISRRSRFFDVFSNTPHKYKSRTSRPTRRINTRTTPRISRQRGAARTRRTHGVMWTQTSTQADTHATRTLKNQSSSYSGSFAARPRSAHGLPALPRSDRCPPTVSPQSAHGLPSPPRSDRGRRTIYIDIYIYIHIYT